MATQEQMARENYERFSYARDNGHLDFVAKAEKCDRYFAGDQWDTAIRTRLERLGKPVITVNKILSTCAAIFGEQLANRADISFRPARDGNAETAAALDKVWMHVANTNKLDWLESDVAADGFIRGRGFFDVRLDFDDHMRGEVRVRTLNAKNVVIDPDADSYDPDEWKEVFTTKWLTLDDIDRNYGSKFAKELSRRPHTAFNQQYDTVDWLPDTFGGKDRVLGYDSYDENEKRRIYRIIERQYKELRWAEFFVDMETGDMRQIPESWDPDRIAVVIQQYGLGVHRKRIENIRWVTTIDDTVLHNAWSPYKHFTPVPYFPYFRHGETIGLVENLISIQDLLNKSISQELHIVNTTANSGWVLKNGTLANMTVEELEERGAEDGLVVVTNTSPRDLEKIQPNQVPSGLDRVSFKADEALKEVSMVSDSMRGFDRADVAAKAIQAKQARGSVSLAKPFDNLAYTRQLLARNVLDLVQTFYTESRLLNITGGGLNDKPEQVEVNQPTPEGTIVNDLTIGEYDVIVSTVPARDSFEQSQFQEAFQLRELGIAIPDDVLIEHSHLNRKGEIADKIRSLNGQGEPSQTAQQMEQLEMQLKELEAKEREANAAVKNSNAELNMARAQKEMAALQNPDGQGDAKQEAELLKVAMDRERMLADLQIQREKIQAEIELQWAKMQSEIELKKTQLQMDMQASRQKASIDMQVAQQKAATDMRKADLSEFVAANKARSDERMASIQQTATIDKANLDRETRLAQVKTDEKIAEARMKAHMTSRKEQK